MKFGKKWFITGLIWKLQQQRINRSEGVRKDLPAVAKHSWEYFIALALPPPTPYS